MKIQDISKIGIIGMGYVGLPLSVAFSKKFEVVGFDNNKNRIDKLKKGVDETNEIIDFKKKKFNIKFTNKKENLINCNIFIITVPTPVNKYNKPNLSNLADACKLVAKILKKNSIIIFESTVYPGCTEEFCKPIIEKYSKLKFNKDFFLGYSPERINPGKSKKKLNDIIKITSGSTNEVANLINILYKKIIRAGTYKVSSIKVAEAAKIIENTQRDINIAFVNELSIIFNKIGIETSEVLKAASTKWNFNKYYPGLVGGHCIGVDPYYLAFKSKLLGHKANMILAGRKLNNEMSNFIFKKIFLELKRIKKNLNQTSVLVLGSTFKENCADFRNSKVFDIVNKLHKNNINFSIIDPYFSKKKNLKIKFKNHFTNFSNLKEKFDIILISVAHDYFKLIGIDRIKKKLKTDGKIFDLKSLFNKKETYFRL